MHAVASEVWAAPCGPYVCRAHAVHGATPLAPQYPGSHVHCASAVAPAGLVEWAPQEAHVEPSFQKFATHVHAAATVDAGGLEPPPQEAHTPPTTLGVPQ
jgi:hypothetical protein